MIAIGWQVEEGKHMVKKERHKGQSEVFIIGKQVAWILSDLLLDSVEIYFISTVKASTSTSCMYGN